MVVKHGNMVLQAQRSNVS